jgi:hypothetical protein
MTARNKLYFVVDTVNNYIYQGQVRERDMKCKAGFIKRSDAEHFREAFLMSPGSNQRIKIVEFLEMPDDAE